MEQNTLAIEIGGTDELKILIGNCSANNTSISGIFAIIGFTNLEILRKQ